MWPDPGTRRKANEVTAENTMEKTGRIRTVWRAPALVFLVAAAATALTGCSRPSSRPFANPGKSHGSTTTTLTGSNGRDTSATPVPKGNASQLLGEWSTCMRNNGDPNQAEPTIDANGAIHVTEPPGYFGTIFGASGNSSTGGGVTCQVYLTEASTTLNGGEPLQSPNLATVDKFAACMRANGVPNFPDPGGGQGPTSASAGGSGPNPNSPIAQRASDLCAKQTGAKGLGFGTALRPGEIEIRGTNGGIAEIVTGTEDVPT
jgi:hypothetical protein